MVISLIQNTKDRKECSRIHNAKETIQIFIQQKKSTKRDKLKKKITIFCTLPKTIFLFSIKGKPFSDDTVSRKENEKNKKNKKTRGLVK